MRAPSAMRSARSRRRSSATSPGSVVNREGAISTRGLEQRHLLEQEGIAFDAHGHAPMARYRWEGPSAAWAAEHGFHTLPAREEGEQLSLF
jgi:methylated-DNA-protein-cysteine methyltransferase related protein